MLLEINWEIVNKINEDFDEFQYNMCLLNLL